MIQPPRARIVIAIAVLILSLVSAAGGLEPVLVRNLDFGGGSSSPCDFVTLGGVQLFAATDSSGRELWKTDGTYLGTSEVKDIRSGGSGSPLDLFVFNSPVLGEIALFTANDGSGKELWRSDGTTAGTQRVADLFPGSGGSTPGDLTYVAAQGKVYFRAFNGTTSRLYQTDGVTTTAVTTLSINGSAGSIAELGGNLFVSAVDSATGLIELIKVNLPAATWQVVADINTTADGSSPTSMTTIDGLIYMSAYTSAAGREPYVTDGTIGNLVSLGDLKAGTQGSSSSFFTPFGGWVYFGSAAGLVRTQGTLATTSIFFSALVASGPLVDTGSLLYAPILVAGIGWEPYVTDGTTVSLVENISPGSGSSVSGGWQAASIDGRLVFRANDGVHGNEPWESTDGTAVGTDILADLEPGSPSSDAGCFRDSGSFGLMGALQSPFGNELFALVETAHDFGDAPDSYGTALADDGARHALGSGLFLGSLVDPELDRPYDLGGIADDSEGLDDEDGTVFAVLDGPNPLLGIGAIVGVDVTVSADGKLDAWADFNLDGDFLDAGEKLTFTDVGGADVVTGVNAKTFQVPATATPGVSYLRFRLSSAGTSSPIGLLADGEVEDYQATIAAAGVDLQITNTDGQTTAAPGEQLTYSIVASNPTGPGDANGSHVTDNLPNDLMECSIECVASGGANCIAEEAGSRLRGLGSAGVIDQDVDLPIGGSVAFTATCTIDVGSSGSLSNTATVSVPAGLSDPNLSNNSATDVDTLVPEGDLEISKTDGLSLVIPPATLTYTILAENPGPSNALGVTVTDVLPSDLDNVTWTCVGSAGGACVAAGGGDISESVDLPAGAAVTFTVEADVVATPPTVIENTATLAAPGGFTDPNGANDSATDATEVVEDTAVIFLDGFESGDISAWGVTEGNGKTIRP